MDDLAQAKDQARAVVHLSRVLADLYADRVKLYETCPQAMADIVDLDGSRSASIMEYLGDVLNGMDAASDEDEWLTPIFHEAQRRWPVDGTR